MVPKLHWLVPGCATVFLLSPAAEAANLTSWQFNPNQNQLDLKTDEGVQPRVQLITNPTRLVIDLPGTRLKRPKINQKIGSLIREIRVGQFDSQTTRIVVEVAPGYTIDPTKVQVEGKSSTQWSVQLPTPEQISSNFSWQPGTISPPETSPIPQTIPVKPAPSVPFAGGVPLGHKMSGLQNQVKTLMAQYKFLQPGMFFLDLETGDYLDINGSRVFPAASTIKLPILIAFFQDVDAGKVKLNETLVMRRDLMASGSGTMQYRKPGTRFSIRETVSQMIIISDNTATNMIIDRLGGIKKLNQRFRSWGLQDTVMNRLLGDFKGTNKTSSKDMVRLLALVANEKLLSPSSQKQALDILHRTKTRTLLPAGLGQGADIAHKTGDIGFLIGDAGIITTPNGKRYLGGIYVRRPYKDVRGRNFIRQVSQLVYKYINQQPSAASADLNRGSFQTTSFKQNNLPQKKSKSSFPSP